MQRLDMIVGRHEYDVLVEKVNAIHLCLSTVCGNATQNTDCVSHAQCTAAELSNASPSTIHKLDMPSEGNASRSPSRSNDLGERQSTASQKHRSALAWAKGLKKSMSNLSSSSQPSFGSFERTSLMLKRIRGLVQSRKFDYVMGGFMFLHLCILSVQLQWKGYEAERRMGLRTEGNNWSQAEYAFNCLEQVFASLYLAELFLRIYAFQLSFFRSIFNVIDALVLVVTWVDALFLSHMEQGDDSFTLNTLRTLRALRIFRFVRIMRYTERLREMHVLVRTLLLSLKGLGWGIIFVGPLLHAGAVLLSQTTQEFLHDASVGAERREWLADHFGTPTQSLYTLFECTLTGRWSSFARPMSQEVSYFFLVFWVVWVVIVNFTVMKVISALFLKHAMAVAAIDSERQAIENMRQKERFASELRIIFNEGDTSGDGRISQEEFDAMLHNPEILSKFRKLDLEIEEVDALFSVCSAEDGEADYEEFLAGSLQMKGSARTIDTIQILHKQMEILRQVNHLSSFLRPQSRPHAHAREARPQN
jgi:voltage-gated sodium channel